jgi:hypothetical protein
MIAEDLPLMSIETLRRKANQAWESAGLARQDRDAKDEKFWTAKARAYDAEIVNRRTGG